MLSEGEEKGVFRITDHESHLNAVALMISFMNLEWMQKNTEPTRRQVLESVAEILLNGLRKEPKC